MTNETQPQARILVIDDELGIREGCRRALSAHGYRVKVAENGPVGLRKMREEGPFDLILPDAMMSGMSGVEALKHCRETAAGCRGRDPRGHSCQGRDAKTGRRSEPLYG